MGVLADLELASVGSTVFNGLLGPEPKVRTPCTPGAKRPSSFVEDLRDLLDKELPGWWSRSEKTPSKKSSARQNTKSSGNLKLRQVSQVSFDDEDDIILISQRGRLDSHDPTGKNVTSGTQTDLSPAQTPRDRSWSWPAPCCGIVRNRNSRVISAPRPRQQGTANSARLTLRSVDSEEPYLPLAIPEVYEGEWNPEEFLAEDEGLNQVEPWQNQMKA